ncbi:aminomethyltransferase family protein [Falsiroseomonas selenitidurans]|uniref:Sarcosine oxidase subunit gamma n=1 Tax=Falsiroseomonas selenitidurans TaxID=2716335 RepID=A0ABX1E054_9PROT|nr:hypothetical protein [Falsiroseomonas selenitidurans]NKC30529.1 hypothetical protein [Falsiroseomonas selenitidurans]
MAEQVLEGLRAPPAPAAPRVTLRELTGCTLTALHGPQGLLAGLPQRPGWAALPGGTAIWTAPGQWLWMGVPPPVPPAHATPLNGARCLLELDGPLATELLATLLPIDLHRRAFPHGAAAATQGAHVPLLVWRAANAFRLACYRSYGLALAGALVAAGRGRALAYAGATPWAPEPAAPADAA